ncbi:SusE domain-containing protein [Pedobacter sp. WC2501]|uniref:SusE domain-containing protein n=1 Tax=Pedobacter sp. WC2501 TaxID=3461400 RepID=UPI00404613AA
MKSILFKSFAVCCLAVSLWSCKKDETQTVSNVSPAGTLTASATSLSLVQANGAKPALTLTFPASTVTGYTIPVTSTIQFDLKGKNFASPKEYVISTTSYSPTVNDFNTMMLALGATIGTPAQIEVRLKSGAAANAMTYSNVITLTATPYLASAWVYVPGAYQGWLPESADSLVSLTSNGIYTGIINFPAGKLLFKVTPAKNWISEYADNGGGKFSNQGVNFDVLTEGLKLLTFNTIDKTWKMENVKQWSVIGEATPGGWGTDTDMKYVNDGSESWKITLNLTAGEYKFREDHKWDNNLGVKEGKFQTNGDNLKIAAAGNYTISLNTKVPSYTIIKN